MSDRNRPDLDHWKTRSAAWTATAATGRATDDTFNQMIIERARIRPGERVLDLGSGTGDPAISIGLSLAGEGAIVACDLTPEMLHKARERSVNVGIGNMDFVGADMSALPFAEASFDCVTCRFGLMFPADRVAAAAEALRVLRPGGRAAYLVWGPYEENPPFFAFRRTVAAALGEDEGPVSARHSLGEPGLLTEILEGAGFTGIEERKLRYKRPVEDLNDYIGRGLRRGYADRLEGLDEAARAELTDRLRETFEAYREDGIVRLPNSARICIGRKG